jgi:gliding motility-associated-like protein
MKKRFCSVLCLLMISLSLMAQDFSNKGKEFWLAYSYHVGMTGGGAPTMTLYLTSDVTTVYTVEIFGITVLQTGTINAGQVVSVNVPSTYFINDEGTFTNRAIRVLGDKPLVVYSYITRSAASGATLCLPTPVLGREYYSANFTQASNEANSNSYFTIIAVEDNTTVEITPAAPTKSGRPANTTFTVNLNKGQIYQVLGTVTGNNGVDLTGSRIRSIASGTGGCKRIAVFSGSGKIRIPATGCTSNSSDNLYQQLYPTGTWGKKYLTVPSRNNPNNYYRVIKSTPTANVYVNGTLIPAASFTNGIYYQFFNSRENLIESDEPISVIQYFTTQGCDGNSSTVPNDPDMIVLNPVEQNIDRVTLVNSNLFAASTAAFPHQHHIHVIMRNGGTGISSFTLDGATIQPSQWVVHPSDPSYSYLYLANVSQGFHRLASDSGFNALAYGYANAESYGYSAGANVKDLYQFVSVQNQYATVSFPAACRNSPFYFSMTFPYQPTEIKWQFSGLFPDVTVTGPTPDSTWIVNGKQLYRYKLPNPYTIPTIGTYPIRVLAQNPTPDGCSGEQEINYDLQVFERPVADFNFTTTGCLSDSVRFQDNSNTNGRPAIRWSWDFTDGGTSGIRNSAHLFTTAGTFPVRYSVITDIGCVSDTAVKNVVLSQPPLVRFGVSTPGCVGQAITFSDSSTTASSTIVRWTWNFGDGSPVVVTTTNTPQVKTYATTGDYTVTLKVETATGCSATSSQTVRVSSLPVPSFDLPTVCLPAGTALFTNTSTINGGTTASMTYSWDFGDGNSSTQVSPTHIYSTTGPFPVRLTATSAQGCVKDTVRNLVTVFAEPQAQFNAPAEVCLGTAVTFQDASSAPGSSVTAWQWNFGDGSPVNTQQSPTHTYAGAGSYTVTLRITSAAGCVATTTRSIVINALPQASFTTSAIRCVNQAVSLTSTSTSADGTLTEWTWNFGDGSTPVTATTSAPQSHTYTTTGSFPATLVVKSSKGCVSPVFSLPITVNPVPSAGFTLPDNCPADPFSEFTDTSTITGAGQSIAGYLWNFGDPNATVANPNTSTVNPGRHRYTVAGTYTVGLTVTSNNGCTATASQVFTLNGALPQASFSLPGGQEYCAGDSVRIVNSSTVSPGRIIRLEIFWDFTNDPSNRTIVNFPAGGQTFAHLYPRFTSPATRNYTIRVFAYSGDNCLSPATQVITVKALPSMQFDPVAPVCADRAPFQLTASGSTGTGVFSGTGVTPSGIFNPATAGAGQFPITYTFNGTNGCSDTLRQVVRVFPVPVANAGPDRFILEGGNGVLSGSGTGAGLSYLWTPGAWLNDPAVAQPVSTPREDITYRLQVTSSDGCTASDEVKVTVLKTPGIPNTFSPNGDGVHDRWEIKHLESYPGVTVDIYNRYGQLVYQSVGYSQPWDGKFKGNPLPAGTYYYIINPKNGRKPMTGFVDIIR